MKINIYIYYIAHQLELLILMLQYAAQDSGSLRIKYNPLSLLCCTLSSASGKQG